MPLEIDCAREGVRTTKNHRSGGNPAPPDLDRFLHFTT